VLRISGRRPAYWLCLALNWLCFFTGLKREILHNTLSYMHLRDFWPLVNWVCFFKLSSNFRRFLLFFTCYFHYSAFFSSIFLNSQFVLRLLYSAFYLFNIIRIITLKVERIPEKSPWDETRSACCVVRIAYRVRRKDSQTGRVEARPTKRLIR